MTTEELANRILRHCNPKDLGDVTFSQGMEIAGAISTALADYYARVPSHMRRTGGSHDLGGPVAKTGLGLTKGSHDVTGVTFESKYVGCTVEIGGWRNLISSSSTLLDDWRGETGTFDATIHHDAIPMGNGRDIIRIANHPWLYDGRSEGRQLIRTEYDHAPMNALNYEGTWIAGAQDNDRWLGDPTHYGIIETGNSQNAENWFIFKVHPAPKETITLRFDVELDPDAISFIQLTCFPVSLPVSDADYELILRPMVEYEMLGSSIWEGSNLAVKKVEDGYARAIGHIGGKLPDRAPTLNELGTPHGY